MGHKQKFLKRIQSNQNISERFWRWCEEYQVVDAVWHKILAFPKKSTKTLLEYFSSKDRRWMYYNRRDGAFWASECFGVHEEGGTSEEYSVVVVTVRSPPLSNKRHLFKCFRRCSETVQSQQKRYYYKNIWKMMGWISSCWRCFTQNFSLSKKSKTKTLREYFSRRDQH